MPTLFNLLKTRAEQIHEGLKNAKKKRIYNISIPYLAILLLFGEKTLFVLEDSDDSATKLYNDLLFFNSSFNSKFRFIYFPPPVNPESIGERAKCLYKIKEIRNGVQEGRETSKNSLYVVITSKEAFRTGFSIQSIEGSFLTLKKGMEIGRARLEGWLRSNGYRDVSIVMEKGEYSRREWLFDIYPVTGEHPVRIEFFGDEIDLLRIFDLQTQRSIKEVEEIYLFPAEEAGFNTDILTQISKIKDIDIFVNSEILRDISLSDLSPEISIPNLQIVNFSHLPFLGDGIDAGEISIKGTGIPPEERNEINDLADAFYKSNKKIISVMSSRSQAERLKEILMENGISVPIIDDREISTYEGIFCITTGLLSSGINLPEILILTDKEIFGERPPYRALRRSRVSKILTDIEDLNAGDFIVHKDHGIGRFVGLQRQRTDDYEQDLVVIEYSNGILYVPFHNINRLQKYSTTDAHIPSIDKLGGKSWQRTKQRVQKGIRDMAEKLLRLYAERKVLRGFRFSEDTPIHKEFDDFFPYEETDDQLKAIEEIKKLMNSDMPMDMLLCGDVGYGKTEIAIRAAFRAVYDGKQVAVLVPTTLLAEQHYRTFKARFSGFPVKIDYLSRFKNHREIKKIISSLSKGEIDIIIGTHMLLNKNVSFGDLGLLIIDEEHRFGVAQKERLKELKKGVDVLTLTATPIPRTLQMSLSGIWQMCTIETPPEERLSVRSVVTTFNEHIIKEAIDRELERKGQVFFVHNRIFDIEKISDFVKRIVPYARLAIAHGRMPERQLEEIMLRFLNKEIDILVCTAIIGSGLDITSANTIIINRADTFGLSDLYQLKGRVGRGNVQAFAYFLIPGEDFITEDAKKRLKAIHEMSYLGAGLKIAMKDLEIRGAGNLLGPEQSGHIHRVGFDLYMEMLEKTVAELKGQEIVEEVDPQIKMKISAYIPEWYISDITVRLGFYRRLSSVKSADNLLDIRDELIDRFGRLPEEVENLLDILKIKVLAKSLYIERISDLDGRYRFYFVSEGAEKYKLEKDFFDKLIHVLFEIQKKEKGIRFLPEGFELMTSGFSAKDALIKIQRILNNIWTMMPE